MENFNQELFEGRFFSDEQSVNIPSKMVSVYLCTTSDDMVEERRSIMKNVYPHLKDLCAQADLDFEIFDLSTDTVSETIRMDQMLPQIRQKCIEKVQRNTVGPNLMILIGDKLGSPALPTEIPEDEFEMFLRLLKTFEPNLGGSILKRLYIKNTNSIPAVYSLQNITDVQQQDATAQKPSYKKWLTQTKQIHNLLHRAATLAREKQLMSDEVTEKYLLPDIEREVIQGLTSSPPQSKKSIGFIRNFELTPDALINPDPSLGTYYDLCTNGKPCAESKNKLYNTYKLIMNLIPAVHVGSFTIHWIETGLTPAYPNHKVYLNEFTDQVKVSLQDIVHRHLDQLQRMEPLNSVQLLEIEVSKHCQFCFENASSFVGRKDVVTDFQKKLKDCWNMPIKLPLLIHGVSGSGKTSLMSKLITEASKWTEKDNLVTIYRFIGHTLESENLFTLLKSICKQICQVYNIQETWSCCCLNSTQTITFFHVLVEELMSHNKPLLIVLDGLDRLQTFIDEDKLISWLPRELNENCMIVLSTEANVKNIQRNFKNFYEKVLNPEEEESDGLSLDALSIVGLYGSVAGSISSRSSKRRKSKDSISFSSFKSRKRHSFTMQRKSTKISPRQMPVGKRPSLPSEMLMRRDPKSNAKAVINGKVAPEPINEFSSLDKENNNEPIYEQIPEIKIARDEESNESKTDSGNAYVSMISTECTLQREKDTSLQRERTHEGLLVGRETSGIFTNDNLIPNGAASECYYLFKLPNTLPNEDRNSIQSNLLKDQSRTLSQDQSDYMKSCIENCPEPLYIKLATDIALTWKSHQSIDLLALPMSISEVIANKFDWLEKQCGTALVSHALSFITLSKHGITESQLLELLALDNYVLNEVYEEASPLSEKNIRLPTLLWKRLEYYLGEYLQELNENGYLVYKWRHNRMCEVATFRYLQNESTMKYLTRLMSEFFLGLHYDVMECDAKMLTLNKRRKKIRYALHQLTPQPTKAKTSYNVRKLIELPHCVMNNGNEKVLFNQLFFNFDWIHQKLWGTGIKEVIDDYDTFLRKYDSFEVQYIRNSLALESIQIAKDMGTFYNILLRILENVDFVKFPNLRKLYDGVQLFIKSSKSPILHYQEQTLIPKQAPRILSTIKQPGSINYVKFLTSTSHKRAVCISSKQNKIFITFYGLIKQQLLSCLVIPAEITKPIVLASKYSPILVIALHDLHIINTQQMKEVCTVASEPQGTIKCIQENVTGTHLAIVYDTGVVRLVELRSFKITTEIETGGTSTENCYFTSDSTLNLLLAPFKGPTLAIVDCEKSTVDQLSLAKLDHLKTNCPTIYNQVTSVLISSSKCDIHSWNIKTRSFFTYYGHSSEITCLTVMNGEYFASGCQTGEIKIWSLAKEALIQNLEGHYDSVLSMQCNLEANILVSCGQDDLIMVWDLEVFSLRDSCTVNRIVTFDTSGTDSIALIGSKDGYARVLELSQEVIDLSSRSTLNTCIELALSPTYEYALVTQSSNSLVLWDLTENLPQWEYNGQVTCACFPTTSNFFIGTPDGSLHIGKIEKKGRTNTTQKLSDSSICLLKHFHDNSLLVCFGDGTIFNFDYTDRSVQQSTQPHNDAIICVAINEKHIAFGSQDCRISLFAREGAKMSLLHICTTESSIEHLVLMENGEHIISGTHSGFNVWDINSGKEIEEMASNIKGINVMFCNKLSGTLVIGTNAECRQFLEMNYQQSGQIKYYKGHKDSISCIRITDNLKYMVTGSFDGCLKVWSNETKKLIDSIQLQSKIVDLVVTELIENWYHRIYAVTCSRTLVVLHFLVTSRKQSQRSFANTGHLIMLNNVDDVDHSQQHNGVTPRGIEIDEQIEVKNTKANSCCLIC